MADAAPQRILIIRPSALGDVARTVPVLVSLRRACPDAAIDWLINEPFVEAATHHPMLDRVIPFPRARLSRFGRSWTATREGLAFARMLREQRYDTVYDCQGLLRSGLLTRLTRAPRRVGFADAREGAPLFYNVKHRPDPALTHTVDRMLRLVEADGVAPEHDLSLHLGPADREWLDAFKQEHQADSYVCVAPTARWRSKCWPIDRYAAVARRLLESQKTQRIVLIASPDEREQAAPFFEHLIGDDPPRTDLRHHIVFPTTTVGQMMALIRGARLLLCNDSAPLHVAVGFDRPIVALFGPTDPAYVGPYRRDDAVIRPADAPSGNTHRVDPDDQSLIARITINEVWRKTCEQLAT